MRYTACYTNSVTLQCLPRDIVARCLRWGGLIRESSVERGMKDNVSVRQKNAKYIQRIGVLGEYIVAWILGLPWIWTMDTFKGPDLKHNIEVRANGDDRYGARVRPYDDDSKRVVCVIIDRNKLAGPYRIPGWINAKYGKRDEWLQDPYNMGRSVFFVPQQQLIHIDRLKALIEVEKSGSLYVPKNGNRIVSPVQLQFGLDAS